jgi:phosphoglycerate dehydrogenase-like enzyme
MTKLLIVIHHRFDLWNPPPWFAERLRKEFPQLDVVQRDGYEGVAEDLREAEILFTISLRPEQLAMARKLRWVYAATAAVHQFLFPEMVASDVVLTNAREVHGPVVAEHVMALLFALAKKIPQAVRLQQKGMWGQDDIWNYGPRPRELAGATLGLIGLGSIGRAVARMAAALGMKVIAVREHADREKPADVAAVFPPAAIDDLLGQSDYVVMAAPLTSATRGMMNAERLRAMKREGYLVNVGRGLQVNEEALADALRQHRIAGAALDVFAQEPLPPDSPLWGLDNLLITPHTGSLTEKLWERHYALFSDNLRRFLAGESLLFMVDKRKGY